MSSSIVAGCLDPFPATTTETASTGDATSGPATITSTITSGEPPGTTTSTPTTTSGDQPPGTTTAGSTTTTSEPWTTGTSETSTTESEPGPPPVQRCQLIPAPDLRDAACDGAQQCRIREAMRFECDGADFYHHLVQATAGGAALYVQTDAVPSFAVQHEAHALTEQGSGLADIWVTDKPFSPAGNLLPRADGQIELWFQDGPDPPAIHYPPQAAIDGGGYSTPDEMRDDIQQFIGTWTRPDDVPMATFIPADSDTIHAMYELPDGRVEQPLIAADAYDIWLHDVAGALKMSWADFDADLDGTYLYVRDLEAPPDQPGTPLVRTGDFFMGRPRDAVLSSFGDGTHGVVLTQRDTGEVPRLVANEPWTYDEELGGTVVDCPTPTCAAGCAAAPQCVESRLDTWGVGLQNGPDSVRAWHLECAYELTLTWEEGSYFDLFCLCNKCRCEGQVHETVEHSCELVASTLAPDPNVPDKLLRSELWRRPLGFEREDLVIDTVVGDDTLWLLSKSLAPTKQIVVWAVDTE
ncbi:hypothetical protein [Nannocystis sp. SCPEA4]|uniref:hypothetical protein n=1 Tax=Nannocystis sp. SCPEA4 TaxID=2996787 RepID=UPI00226E50C2|nr:hypothetical protein [Nannocystis sp. SCPEA4]MCY1054845.1 hypothetical protein [Nannocystis sp. SCPEA4]